MANQSIIEEWRIVTAWPNYEVSDLGNVRRAIPTYWINPQNGLKCTKYRAGRPLKPSRDKDGYRGVTLVGDKTRKRRRVATLVCEAFHGVRPSPRHQVAHGDGKNTNDASSNLRWATPRENIEDAIQHGTWVRGERNGNAILTAAHVRTIRQRLATGEIARTIAADFGVRTVTVQAIKDRRIWAHL